MVDPLDPNKYHILSGRSKLLITLLFLAFVFMVLPFGLTSYYRLAIHRPSQTSKEVTFEISKGEGVSEIAQRLAATQAINSNFLFNVYVMLNNKEGNIQAGTYVIPAGSTLVTIVDQFSHGTNDLKVTFLEGWRVEEFAREASKKFKSIDYRKFVSLASNKEGYLYPDTYVFNVEVQEEELLAGLEQEFFNKTSSILSPENLKKIGLTSSQAVIIASIVEREAFDSSDKPIIAGILIKRFKEGMKLDADATTQYVAALTRLCPAQYNQGSLINTSVCIPTEEDLQSFNWWPNDLTLIELADENPYNTRKSMGLPPAPISSFSADTLSAVVFAQETDYYYYLHDLGGKVHFAKTLAEHTANIARYLNN